MGKLVLVAALCTAVVLSGCNADTSPTTVSRYEPGKRVRLRTAPAGGDFLLYAAADEGAASASHRDRRVLVLMRQLSKGQRLGFVREPGGAVVAVAGGERIALDGRPHAWVMEADPGQFDAGNTAELVLVVIVIAGAVIGAVVAASMPDFDGVGWGYF